MMLASTLVFLLASACETKTTAVACEQMELGRAKDECLHSEIKTLDANQSQQVLSKAKLIQDPMIRGAAVSAWIGDNNNNVDSNTGQALCTLLDGRDRSYCMRRLSSPHLKR
ncbi:MAG: hypothetical protein ACON4U_19535 [Myxococcota bacterium]